MSYEIKIVEGRKEYHEDGELIAFINDSGNLQAAHGKSDRKADLQAWIEETGDGTDEENPQVDANPINPAELSQDQIAQAYADAAGGLPIIHEHEEDRPPKPAPGTARFAFSAPDAPYVPKPKPTGPPAVPASQPRQKPGFGILTPDLVWWAWHQPDEVFQGIYKQPKAEWEKEHGGYLEKIRNREVKGGLQ